MYFHYKQKIDQTSRRKKKGVTAKQTTARQNKQNEEIKCSALLFSICLNLKSFTVPLIFLFNRNSFEVHVSYVERIFMPFMLCCLILTRCGPFPQLYFITESFELVVAACILMFMEKTNYSKLPTSYVRFFIFFRGKIISFIAFQS